MKTRTSFYVVAVIGGITAALFIAAFPVGSSPLPQGVATEQPATQPAVASTAQSNARTDSQATMPPTVEVTAAAAGQPVTYEFDSVNTFDAPGPTGAAYLSPDGQHIAAIKGSQLCTYDAQGQMGACVDIRSLDRNSIRWSPDSKMIAFTEDFFHYFINSDIYVMNVASGKITDLTDDHLIKFQVFNAPPGAPVPNLDVVPTWYSDSQHLLFVRYTQALGTWIANLYTIPVDGGALVLNGVLATPRYGTYALALSPDNKLVAYNVDSAKAGDPQNGLSLTTLDGKNPRQLTQQVPATPVPAFKPSLPTAIEFSPDGHYLLLFDPHAMATVFSTNNIPTSRVVSIDGTFDSPVDADNVAQWATWSPTGTALAYIVRDAKNPQNSGLYIADKPGAAGRLIYQPKDQTAPLIPPVDIWRTMDWASNNTILVAQNLSGARKFYLVHLKAK